MNFFATIRTGDKILCTEYCSRVDTGNGGIIPSWFPRSLWKLGIGIPRVRSNAEMKLTLDSYYLRYPIGARKASSTWNYVAEEILQREDVLRGRVSLFFHSIYN